MNEQIIKFKAKKLILSDKSIYPEPAKMNIADWYKNVPYKNDSSLRTIKACKPFLDSLLAGYILKSAIDQKINFHVENPNNNNQINTWIEVHPIIREMNFTNHINVNRGDEVHPPEQVGGMSCPFLKENKGYPIYKILNPWTITLPKGYSAIYMPPINRPDDRFQIITGIVDYGHDIPTNFPVIFKKQGSWILEKGTPIASIFPFKIEKWKMVVEEMSDDEFRANNFSLAQKLMKFYEKFKWIKKSWN
jgi:hypothetical protein